MPVSKISKVVRKNVKKKKKMEDVMGIKPKSRKEAIALKQINTLIKSYAKRADEIAEKARKTIEYHKKTGKIKRF